MHTYNSAFTCFFAVGNSRNPGHRVHFDVPNAFYASTSTGTPQSMRVARMVTRAATVTRIEWCNRNGYITR